MVLEERWRETVTWGVVRRRRCIPEKESKPASSVDSFSSELLDVNEEEVAVKDELGFDAGGAVK